MMTLSPKKEYFPTVEFNERFLVLVILVSSVYPCKEKASVFINQITYHDGSAVTTKWILKNHTGANVIKVETQKNLDHETPNKCEILNCVKY